MAHKWLCMNGDCDGRIIARPELDANHKYDGADCGECGARNWALESCDGGPDGFDDTCDGAGHD